MSVIIQNISKRERYIVALDYLLWFSGLSLLDILGGMSKNTEFMNFHRKQSLRVGIFVLVGVALFLLALGADALFPFSDTVMNMLVNLSLIYILLSFFFIFKGMYYGITGQTKKVF